MHNPTDPRPADRLLSLDAFRGFIILSMVFVNYLPGMPGVPGWLLHAPADVDGYTLTDVVFPAFLFIVGVAIPLALEARLARGAQRAAVMRHVLIRGAALIFLGVILVNHGNYSETLSLLPERTWYFLAYLSIVLIWIRQPREGTPRFLSTLRWSRRAALLLLVLLLAGFRRETADGGVGWLATEWWGILGIIGWSYLVSAGLYLLFRRHRTCLMGWLGLMIAIVIADEEGVFQALEPLRHYWSIGGLLGAHPAIILAGVLVGMTLRRADAHAEVSRLAHLRFMTGFGAGLFAAGQLIRPLHGISKIGATESFALVTAGLSCLLFAVCFSLIEVAGARRWAALLVPAGRNPLFAYLLPSLLGSLMAFTGTWSWFWPFWDWGGLWGLVNAAVMTLLVLALTAVVTRWKIVLHL